MLSSWVGRQGWVIHDPPICVARAGTCWPSLTGLHPLPALSPPDSALPASQSETSFRSLGGVPVPRLGQSVPPPRWGRPHGDPSARGDAGSAAGAGGQDPQPRGRDAGQVGEGGGGQPGAEAAEGRRDRGDRGGEKLCPGTPTYVYTLLSSPEPQTRTSPTATSLVRALQEAQWLLWGGSGRVDYAWVARVAGPAWGKHRRARQGRSEGGRGCLPPPLLWRPF